jgi:hypothetical protein
MIFLWKQQYPRPTGVLQILATELQQLAATEGPQIMLKSKKTYPQNTLKKYRV